MNPYYPVKPCPYQDPSKAPPKLRFAIFSGPKKLIYHVATELKWLLTTGLPRAARMLVGREKFRVNSKILREKHQRHYTGRVRTQHYGRNTYKTKSYFKRRKRNL